MKIQIILFDGFDELDAIAPIAPCCVTIANLHKRGYAEPNDWSNPLPTGREDETG